MTVGRGHRPRTNVLFGGRTQFWVARFLPRFSCWLWCGETTGRIDCCSHCN